MAIPALKKRLAETQLAKFCKTRVPPKYQNEIRMSYRIRGNSITLIESRPAMFGKKEWTEMPIAQFRYSDADAKWTLYCADRNDKWHLYTECDPAADIGVLIDEVDADPTCIFFG